MERLGEASVDRTGAKSFVASEISISRGIAITDALRHLCQSPRILSVLLGSIGVDRVKPGSDYCFD